MSVYDFNSLKDHVGHNIEVVLYGEDRNVSIKCTTCNEVLLDYDNPTYKPMDFCPRCGSTRYYNFHDYTEIDGIKYETVACKECDYEWLKCPDIALDK